MAGTITYGVLSQLAALGTLAADASLVAAGLVGANARAARGPAKRLTPTALLLGRRRYRAAPTAFLGHVISRVLKHVEPPRYHRPHPFPQFQTC